MEACWCAAPAHPAQYHMGSAILDSLAHMRTQADVPRTLLPVPAVYSSACIVGEAARKLVPFHLPNLPGRVCVICYKGACQSRP